MPDGPDWGALLGDVLRDVATLEPHDREVLLAKLPMDQKLAVDSHWRRWAHDGQYPDDGDWRVWLMMAGRGFGKTRAGSEWVSRLARADGSLRFALIGATIDDVRKVMIEGESGLLNVAHHREKLSWNVAKGELVFASGAIAHVYSAESFEKLRGPEHHHAWCDELGKWNHADKCWDNMMLGLRLGERPRIVVTTTPRSMDLLHRLKKQEAPT